MLTGAKTLFENVSSFEVGVLTNSMEGEGVLLLPELDKNGFLPPGIHHASATVLSARFATTPYRQNLWNRSIAFLNRATALRKFSAAYIAGGFVSSKQSPSDVDLILEPSVPYGFDAFRTMEPFFAQGLDKILMDYYVHLNFWCRGFPESIWDRREFFQQVRPADASRLGLPHTTRRGIVRIDLQPL